MSDEAKPSDNVIETKQTVEALDLDGKTMDRATSPLASIFDKIQAGKEEGIDAREALKSDLEPAKKQNKPAEPEREEEEEKKVEPSDLSQRLDAAQKKKADKVTDDAEVSRKALEDAAEDKKVEVKTEVEKKEEPEIPEDELKVLPHDKPKTAKRIEALLKKIGDVNAESAKTKAERDEKSAKLDELEKKLGEVKTVDPKTEEAIKKQQDELAMYRRRYGLENDPEVKSKYDDRISAAEAEVPEILKKNGANEAILNLIKEEGGWQKFTRSNRTITLADGTTVTASQFADTISNHLPYADKSRLQALTLEQINLQRDKDRYFKDEQSKASEYFKKQEEEGKKSETDQQAKIQETANMIKSWHESAVQKYEWLKEKPVPANATSEQKAAIEDGNKYTKQLNALLLQSVAPKTPEAFLDVVTDSVRYFQQRRENAALVAENAKLVAENTKLKSSSRSTPKGGSINGGGGGGSAVVTDKEKPKSITEAFDVLARGDKLE